MSASTSSIIESQILHTATARTLHAHHFSKSSTQATYALTDALSRYLALLAETCARYAQHAGRTGVTIRDALAAFEEIGVGVDELREYIEGEARELVRYTGQTARRTDELVEVKAVVSDGLQQSHSAIQLVYARVPDVNEMEPSLQQETDMESLETLVDSGVSLAERATPTRSKDLDIALDTTRALDPDMDLITPPSSPHLPPSPVSPLYARKRARTSNWKAPEYIPDFLPPFPGHPVSLMASPPHQPTPLLTETVSMRIESTIQNPTPQVPMSSSSKTTFPMGSPLVPEDQRQPPRAPSPVLPTSTSTSFYLSSVPYQHSSLSSVPEWRLPKPPLDRSPPAASSTIPALLSSHSYLQSSSLSAPALQSPNPLRHSLAMMLLGASSRAYSPAATLFASSNTNTCAPLPHRAAPLAAHAIPLDKNGKMSFSTTSPRGILPVPPSEWHARSAAGPVAIVDSTAMQGSRIPTLARTMLSTPVISRTTRLIPPPPLERNDQKLLYGPPLPAPWNSISLVTSNDGKGIKGSKDKDEGEEEEDKVLSDANLFATWDYDPKDFRASLPVARRGSRMAIGFGGVNGTLPTIK